MWCGVIWESNEDKQFVKRVGKCMRTWTGCNRKGYTYSAHATFAGLLLTPGRPVSDHTFFCTIHKA